MTGAWTRDDAFCWVDDYFACVKGHFEVREADSLLMILPNRAVKLNATALTILKFLKNGGSVGQILESFPSQDKDARRMQTFHFLCDFRSLMSGCLGEGRNRKAVEIQPHGATFNTLPVLSEIAVTYRCNLKCRFCYASCGCGIGKGSCDEMSASDISEVLRKIRGDAQVPSVSITGGEPLLRNDLELIVAEAVAIGLRANLISNGTLMTSELAVELKAAGLASAQISLEGPDAATHDSLTAVAGSFEKTVAGINALKGAGIHVHTNTTVSAGNCRKLPELVRFAASLGMKRISMNLIIPSGSALDRELQVPYSGTWSAIEPARAEARRLGIEFMWYSPTPMCIMNPIAEGLGNKSCAACDGLLSVAPNGDVLPCSSCPEPVGNLLRQPFQEVWNSASALFYRRKEYAPAECAGCAKFLACAGACPLYWSAMGTSELASMPHQMS